MATRFKVLGYFGDRTTSTTAPISMLGSRSEFLDFNVDGPHGRSDVFI